MRPTRSLSYRTDGVAAAILWLLGSRFGPGKAGPSPQVLREPLDTSRPLLPAERLTQSETSASRLTSLAMSKGYAGDDAPRGSLTPWKCPKREARGNQLTGKPSAVLGAFQRV